MYTNTQDYAYYRFLFIQILKGMISMNSFRLIYCRFTFPFPLLQK